MVKSCDDCGVVGNFEDGTGPDILKIEGKWRCQNCHQNRLRESGRKMFYRCEDCTVFVCPEECFNKHPGSMIAMKKLIRAMNKEGKVHIAGQVRE